MNKELIFVEYGKPKELSVLSVIFLSAFLFSIFLIPSVSAIKGVVISPAEESTLPGGINITIYQNVSGYSYNVTYHSVFLSTAVFNSTFNSTYHSVFLSTGTFNSTFNATYDAYNTSTGLAGYYVPYTGATTNVSLGNNNLTANWLFGNINWSWIQNAPPGIGGTFNDTYHSVFLSTGTFNSTFNDTYHSVFLSTGTFNSTFNDTYHSVFLSTADFNSTFNATYAIWAYNQTGVFNSTFNDTYHSVFLSTATFNSTFNATYAAYNTSTGLAGYYVPYTGAIKSVDLSTNNLTVNNETVNGSINFGDSYSATDIRNLIHFATSPYGNATADGFRVDWNPAFESANDDWLLFTKTDSNDIIPDGGIGFGYINGSGYNATLLRIYFDGNRIDSAVNINLTNHNLTDADWLFGKINWSNVQNYPGTFNSTYDQWAYNQTGVLNYTFNETYHSVFLSTGTFNSTFNDTYHSVFLSTGTFNSTYNDTYHSVFLSTATFNSTFNDTYHSVFLSTATFNSTFNATYAAYNTSTGLSAFYVKKSGDNITGSINMTGNNITGINYLNPSKSNLIIGGNVSINGNITADQFIMGQPLTGMLGSGLIESTESSNFISGVNITCTGLSCSYNAFRVRLASTTSDIPAKYCNISAGTVTPADNTFSAFYVDSNCNVQSTTYDTWYTTMLGKTQAWDFAHVLAHGGTVEVNDAISLEQKRLAKERVLTYYLDQAKVVNGFNFQANAWPYFNTTSGKTVFGMDVVNIDKKNVTSTEDILEWVGHNQSSSTWQFIDGRGINVTSCDNGTDVVLCTGNNWRRHFIFIIGYDDSKNKAEVHQLFPSQTLSYTSAANCLDTITNPITFTMPDEYTGANMMLYAYCAQRTTTSWITTNLIDLRTVKTGTATAGTDTSGLVPYTGATQNVNLADFNLSASSIFMLGNLNMTRNNITEISYINPAGSQINSKGNFSTTANISANWIFGNITINSIVDYPGSYNSTYNSVFLSTGTFNSTYNDTYHSVFLSTATFNLTYNETYHNILKNINSTYVLKTGDNITGFLNVTQNITVGENLTVAGRVGIGTSGPAVNLHINSSSTIVRLESGGDSNVLLRFNTNNIAKAQISYRASDDALTISHSESGVSVGSNYDIVDKGGLIGLGTAIPTHTLTVIGDANVTGSILGINATIKNSIYVQNTTYQNSSNNNVWKQYVNASNSLIIEYVG